MITTENVIDQPRGLRLILPLNKMIIAKETSASHTKTIESSLSCLQSSKTQNLLWKVVRKKSVSFYLTLEN